MKRKTRQRRPRFVYEGEALRAIAFPLGGIGAGQVAICGDGGLRQWQIFNNISHNAHVPHSFFGVCAGGAKSRRLARMLQSRARYDDKFEAAPSISDHIVPRASRLLLEELPGVESITFVGEYPVAEIHYSLPELPIDLRLSAYSPFVPLDSDDSGLPAAIFHFDLTNPTTDRIEASILMSQQNAVGWDGSSEIDGNLHPGFGGNCNKVGRGDGLTVVNLTNPSLPGDHPHSGHMLIAALDENASAAAQWIDPGGLWADFRADGRLEVSAEGGPSPRGQTINAAIACPVVLEPESEMRITFLLTWHFPNRYVDWEQPTFEQEPDIEKSPQQVR